MLKYLYLVTDKDGTRFNNLGIYAEILVTPTLQYA